MTPGKQSTFNLISTGISGLDDVLDGGLPEYSFNLIGVAPGSGKTTLIHQLIFANATPERPVLYLTVLGEPSMKMLRYQKRMTFFDAAKVGTSINYIDLSEDVLNKTLGQVLERIKDEVKKTNATVVAV